MSDDMTPPPPPEGAPPPPPPAPPTPPPAYGSAPPPPAAPPTPPPAYGSAPPPYTGGPEAPVPAGSGPYNAVDAIKYGWSGFTNSPATLLVPALIVIVVVGVSEFILTLILNSTLLSNSCTVNSTTNGISVDCGHGLFVRLIGAAIIAAVVSFIGQLLSAGLIKSALNNVDGKAVEIGDIFTYAMKPNVLTTAAIVAGAGFVGTLLCYVPGIIVGVLTGFAMYFVVDKDLSPIDAIQASVKFVTGHFGDLVLFYVLSVVVIIVGLIACLIGVFAAIPVVLIAASYTFRRLHDEPVSPIG
jgi:uncharacterized membrane protein